MRLTPRTLRQFRTAHGEAVDAALALLAAPHSDAERFPGRSVGQVVGSTRGLVLVALARHADMAGRYREPGARVSFPEDIAALTGSSTTTVADHLRWWANTPFAERVEQRGRLGYWITSRLRGFGTAA